MWIKNNMKLTPESKVIIGLGDSFTQGQGACSLEIWEKANWDPKEVITQKNDKALISSYENSWVNQICENHLTEYVGVNLGMNGRGNRAAVKELYLNPTINLHLPKEKIVIYMLTGPERFDFIHPDFKAIQHFTTMWPNVGEKVEQKELWGAYVEHIWSDRFGAIELILNINEVQTWCKANDAKLILCSAFTPDIKKESLINKIKSDDRNDGIYGEFQSVLDLVDTVQWNDFCYPGNFNSMTDYLLHLEDREDLINETTPWPFHKYAYALDKLSPKGYISKDAHPSYLGHKKIAEALYKFILNPKEQNGKKIPPNII
jgi:hypothetical protein